MKETHTAPEAARALRVGLDYVYKLVWSGVIPATKDSNGRWQIESRHIRQRIAAMEARRGSTVGQ